MTAASPYLIPEPHLLRFAEPAGRIALSAHLQLDNVAGPDAFALELINKTLAEAPASSAPSQISSIRLIGEAPAHSAHEEAYRLEISSAGITIQSATTRGRYYGAQTLRQLIMNYGRELPFLLIEDAPDYRHRGFMHDVSRGKVPKLEALFNLVETLGYLKFNQLQLYIEHTFAFERHPAIGEGHSPLTAQDIRDLDAHCRKHHIALVPNLQSFGHASHILEHEQYRHLAESDFRGGWTLSPVEQGTYELLRELYAEFLPNFSHSEFFNVGCDETWDLGKGKSAELAAKIGLGRLYLGHLLHVRKLVQHHGRRMMFWGDIIGYYPELVPEIPEEVVLLNWWYEGHGDEKQYKERVRPAKKAGLEHWVCPGTSAWNSFFFRMKNAKTNIRAFAKAGLWGKAAGFLVTDWGDHGHYNFLSYSLWPIAWAADSAWNTKAKSSSDFDRRFALLLLGDRNGDWIKPLKLLGNLYLDFGVRIQNNSPERWFFTGCPEPRQDRLGVSGELKSYNEVKIEGLKKAKRNSERAIALLEKLSPSNAEVGRICGEWILGARMSAHACKRALWLNCGEGDPKALKREAEELMQQFQSMWLDRNRASDLESNLYDFRKIIAEYDSDHPMPVTF
jgi:hexosaminidase